MDRLTGDLEGQAESGGPEEVPAIPLRNDAEHLIDQSNLRLAIPERLLNLDELDVLYDESNQSLWTFMRPKDRPSFTPTMLSDFEQWQGLIDWLDR